MSICIWYIIVTALFIGITGCSKPEKKEPSEIVDELSGAATIKRGEALKKKIKEIDKAQKEREKELEEIE